MASRFSQPSNLEDKASSACPSHRMSREDAHDLPAERSSTGRHSGCSIRNAGEWALVQEFSDFARAVDMPDVPHDRFSAKVVQNRMFKNGITFIVALTVVQMGLAVEFQDPASKRAWQIWHLSYTAICTLEMLLMIDAYRSIYFTTRWMLLDFGLAISSILDTCIFPVIGITQDFDMFRMLRLVRVLRIIKVSQVFPEFAVILTGLVDSFLSMFWIFALLLLILYAAGICCTGILGGDDAGYPAYSEHEVNDLNNFIYFGTLARSMLTLLGMLLLSEWNIARKVGEVHPWMILFFVFFLVFVTFGVFNVIIGIVVEKTTLAINQPKLYELKRNMELKAEVCAGLSELVEEIDENKDGSVSLVELEKALRNPVFSDKLQTLELPYNFTIAEFLNMLDLDGDGFLSKHEFVSGLSRLIFSNDWQRECLHAMEIGMLHRSVKKIEKSLTANFGILQSDVRESIAQVNTIRLSMGPPANDAATVARSSVFSTSSSIAPPVVNRPGEVIIASSTAHLEPLPESVCDAMSVKSHSFRVPISQSADDDPLDVKSSAYTRRSFASDVRGIVGVQIASSMAPWEPLREGEHDAVAQVSSDQPQPLPESVSIKDRGRDASVSTSRSVEGNENMEFSTSNRVERTPFGGGTCLFEWSPLETSMSKMGSQFAHSLVHDECRALVMPLDLNGSAKGRVLWL